ncbi:hypothetical protein PUN28_004026 [Cardiocondyla obscurior]|uniref:Uncharacterized protein n=1 Tax=Cardiocondyla obscurior TaxID=286306 RepID=A0AAW2GLC7_9HYME
MKFYDKFCFPGPSQRSKSCRVRPFCCPRTKTAQFRSPRHDGRLAGRTRHASKRARARSPLRTRISRDGMNKSRVGSSAARERNGLFTGVSAQVRLKALLAREHPAAKDSRERRRVVGPAGGSRSRCRRSICHPRRRHSCPGPHHAAPGIPATSTSSPGLDSRYALPRPSSTGRASCRTSTDYGRPVTPRTAVAPVSACEAPSSASPPSFVLATLAAPFARQSSPVATILSHNRRTFS